MTAKNGVSLNWGGFDKAMGKAALKLGNTKSLMNSVGEALVSGTLQRFADEEDPQGQKWPKSGRAANEGGQTLTDTGRLQKSIDYAATPDKVMVGSTTWFMPVFTRKAAPSRLKRQNVLSSRELGAERYPLIR